MHYYYLTLPNICDIIIFLLHKAHKSYPNLKILGSENWGGWSEWKNVLNRDFVAGIFVWTGFAYIGEAGTWPRKRLEILFFDYAGFKTPRGHFFECLWKENPKVYVVTTPATESEYSFDLSTGWNFTQRDYAIPSMNWLRRWEWDVVYEKWNYQPEESVVVQSYTNCEEVELFLNGKSLGKKSLSDFEYHIVKWMVDYQKGELKVVGYNRGIAVDHYSLKSHDQLGSIELHASRTSMKANHYDAVLIDLALRDQSGTLITNQEQNITFESTGDVTLLGGDNGWEMNVQKHKTNQIETHHGKALAIFQSNGKPCKLKVFAKCGDLKSNVIEIEIK